MNDLPFRRQVGVLSLVGVLALLSVLALAWAPWRSAGLQAQTKAKDSRTKYGKEELEKLKALFKGSQVIVYVCDLPGNQSSHRGAIVDIREIFGRQFLVLEGRGIPRAGVPQGGATVICIDCDRIIAISQVREGGALQGQPGRGGRGAVSRP
jgi:hypothetical protein